MDDHDDYTDVEEQIVGLDGLAALNVEVGLGVDGARKAVVGGLGGAGFAVRVAGLVGLGAESD
jgi:hypothetical protein